MNIQDLVPVDHDNQRVLLTAQLAAVYDTTAERISHNFCENKEQFKEGVHYFKLSGSALREFKKNWQGDVENPHSQPFSKMANCLYLWTYQGCVRHCKMINTQAAWDMFNELERVYFGVLESEVVQPEIVQPELPFNKQFSASARRAAAREFKQFKQNPLLPPEHNPELARELIEVAKLLTPSEQRDGVIFYALNLLVGKNIF